MAHLPNPPLSKTPLNALHHELGARMVPFAGYEMPVQYPTGILAEHLHTRDAAGLFDVSHMGQVRIVGREPAAALERLVPGDLQALSPGRMRYTLFTNERAGILDDLMVTRRESDLFVVVNASCKHADIAHMRAQLADCTVEYLEDRALLALQGPAAIEVMRQVAPPAASLGFMSGEAMPVGGVECFVTRSGYTGEDGFEISVPVSQAEALARLLLQDSRVRPVGLGARDSLRLEAGLCLYGHDIDTETTPVEAGLAWTISKRRREQGGFPGDAVVRRQLSDGVARRRVGLLPEGRAPVREGGEVLDSSSEVIGKVTSGGFGPSVNRPIAMGYVATAHAKPGTKLQLMLRGKPVAAEIAAMPFVTKRSRT